MFEQVIPIFGMLSVFGSISFIVYLYYSTRHRERMALIERGVDASIFAGEQRGISITLRLSLLAMGVGCGILLAELLFSAGLREDVAFPAMIFLFGGLGLLIAYWLDDRNREKLNDARERRDIRQQQRQVQHQD